MKILLVSFFAIIIALPAFAIRPLAEPSAAMVKGNTRPPASTDAGAANDAQSMRAGTIEELDIVKGRLVIRKTAFSFNPATVKIFMASQPAAVKSLDRGRQIQFLLDPSDSTRRTIAVVYLN